MDAKNEDSGGSDSLDKSLQQKCKMDDVHQLEGISNSNTTSTTSTAPIMSVATDAINLVNNNMSEVLNAFKEHSDKGGDAEQPKMDSDEVTVEGDLIQKQHDNTEQRDVYTKYKKTDNYMLGNGINAAATEARESSLRFFKASSTITNTIFTREDSSSSGSNSSNSGNNSINNNHHNYRMQMANVHNSGNVNCSLDGGDGTNVKIGYQVGVDEENVGSCSRISNNNGIDGDGDNSIVEGCNNIETTVKQISQNLQETTLETSTTLSYNATTTNSASITTANITSPTTIKLTNNSSVSDEDNESSCLATLSSPMTTFASSASLPSLSNSNEICTPIESVMTEGSELETSSSFAYNGPSTSRNAALLNQSESDTSFMASDSAEETADQRSKKVRFHPDVKENDGGNRVIPKKKKKTRLPPPTDDGPQSSSATSSASSSSQASPLLPSQSLSSSSSSLSSSSSSLSSIAATATAASTVAVAPGTSAIQSPSQLNSGIIIPERNTGNSSTSSDMELDECNEEISEDEEDFDMNRTITEAEAYLKENPITFVPPSLPNNRLESFETDENNTNKNRNISVQLPSGLMSEEDLPSSDEEEKIDVFTNFSMQSGIDNRLGENGVENIYGKRTINGEVFY